MGQKLFTAIAKEFLQKIFRQKITAKYISYNLITNPLSLNTYTNHEKFDELFLTQVT